MKLGQRHKYKPAPTSDPDAEPTSVSIADASSPSSSSSSPAGLTRRAQPTTTLTFTLEDSDNDKSGWQTWDDAVTTSPNAPAAPTPASVPSMEVEERSYSGGGVHYSARADADSSQADGHSEWPEAPKVPIMPDVVFEDLPVVTASDSHSRYTRIRRDAFFMKITCILTLLFSLYWILAFSVDAEPVGQWWLGLFGLFAFVGLYAAFTLNRRLILAYLLFSLVYVLLQAIFFFNDRQKVDQLVEAGLFLFLAMQILFIPFLSGFKDIVPDQGHSDPIMRLFTSDENSVAEV